jgi:hypothetical protein
MLLKLLELYPHMLVECIDDVASNPGLTIDYVESHPEIAWPKHYLVNNKTIGNYYTQKYFAEVLNGTHVVNTQAGFGNTDSLLSSLTLTEDQINMLPERLRRHLSTFRINVSPEYFLTFLEKYGGPNYHANDQDDFMREFFTSLRYTNNHFTKGELDAYTNRHTTIKVAKQLTVKNLECDNPIDGLYAFSLYSHRDLNMQYVIDNQNAVTWDLPLLIQNPNFTIEGLESLGFSIDIDTMVLNPNITLDRCAQYASLCTRHSAWDDIAANDYEFAEHHSV